MVKTAAVLYGSAAWFTLVCHEHKRNLTQSPSTEKISEMMKLPKGMLIFGDYFKD